MSKKSIDLVGPWLVDEGVNGISDEFFDNVIKHIDFPLEDVEGNALAEDWDAGFQFLELPSSDVLAGLSSSFYGKICNDSSGAANDAPEYEEKHKVKGLLRDNAKPPLNGDILIRGTFGGKDSNLFHSSSSVSVLEGNSSCSAENLMSLGSRIFIPVKRPRSKRLRPTTFNQKLVIPFMSSSGSAPKARNRATVYESCSGSNIDEQMAESSKRRGKKRNLSVLSDPLGINDHLQQPVANRKCTHCEVTKTPQWREGPLGPKTLCNACGVRYRSGRLFPEYRPAASPTFVASLHSNSHRRVIEMRRKANREGAINGMDALRPVQLGNSSSFLPI